MSLWRAVWRSSPGLLVLMLMGLAACGTSDPPPEGLRWVWSGGVTDSEAVIVAAVAPGMTPRLEAVAAEGRTLQLPARATDADGIVRFRLTGLQPATRYRYRVLGEGATPLGEGRLRTFPPALEAASFSCAFSACNGELDASSFAAIQAQDPLFFIYTGDFHYGNILADDPALFRSRIEPRLAAPLQAAMLRALPIAYIWDDHDYGGNNSGFASPSRSAAHLVYRQLVPHYPLVLRGPEAPIAQAFTVGRVRFVLTDLRSEQRRVPGSLLGPRQRAWFLAELSAAARDHALVVWVSSVPWNGLGDSTDRWEGNPAERQLIADHVKREGVPLCIIAGDAHMVAIDDGRFSDFATGGGAPIPVFQAAALARRGSYKGGPYSHGARPGRQQFGLMRVDDDGQRIEVEWSARDGSDGRGDRILRATRDGAGPIALRFTLEAPLVEPGVPAGSGGAWPPPTSVP